MGSITVNLDILGARTRLQVGPDADFQWLSHTIEQIVRNDEGVLHRDAQVVTIQVSTQIPLSPIWDPGV